MVQMALAQVPQRPILYARATTALANADDRSLALGLSGRPFAQLPVDLAVERRFALARGQADRFAALVVAGGAWTPRHSRIRLEGYGQAGVVDLADPQAFFDLQMLASGPVHVTDVLSVSLGGGLWAGSRISMRRGASRGRTGSIWARARRCRCRSRRARCLWRSTGDSGSMAMPTPVPARRSPYPPVFEPGRVPEGACPLLLVRESG